MIKILYYEPSSGYGGSSSNLYHILRRLDKTKCSPVVVTHAEGVQFDRMKAAGIAVIKIPFAAFDEVNKAGHAKLAGLFFTEIIPLVFKLVRLIKQEKVDLIHINTNIMLGIPAIIAGKLTGKKIFSYIRETRPLITREKFLAKMIDKLTVLTNFAQELYKKDVAIEKLEVLYDGVDFDEFSQVNPQAFRREFNLEQRKLVGLVGRIVRGKGQYEFVKVAKVVCQKLPDVKFVIVGDAKGGEADYLEEVKALVKSDNLGQNVLFTGWRNDVKNIVAALDILVLASTTYPEGMPNTVIEAMVLNKPVVVTKIPGPTEIVVDKITGFIVPPGDIKAMAEQILFLFKDPGAARAMGEAGRKRAEEFFNVRKVAARLEKLYSEAVASR